MIPGDRKEKLQRVLKLYSEDVFRVCLHLMKDELKAQKILKDVFVQFCSKIDWMEHVKGIDLDSESELVRSYLIVLARRSIGDRQYEESDKVDTRSICDVERKAHHERSCER